MWFANMSENRTNKLVFCSSYTKAKFLFVGMDEKNGWMTFIFVCIC